MEDLVVLVFLVSLIAILVFLALGVWQKIKRRPAKKYWQRAGIALVVFIIAGIFMPEPSPEEKQAYQESQAAKEREKEESKKAKESSKALAESEKQAEKESKEKAKEDSKKQKEAEKTSQEEDKQESQVEESKEKKAENKPQEKSYEEIGKEAFRDNFIKVDDYGPRVNVTFQAVDGLTDGMTEEGIQINIYNFLERLEGKDYETIFFKVMFPTTSGDLSTMANVELEKEAVDSINFDKQNFEDVKDKAKTYDVRIK